MNTTLWHNRCITVLRAVKVRNKKRFLIWTSAILFFSTYVQLPAKATEPVRFGAITDVHNGPGDNEPVPGIWLSEQRWFSNAPLRMAAFAETMNALGNIDFCVDLGDIVDSLESVDANRTELKNVMASRMKRSENLKNMFFVNEK